MNEFGVQEALYNALVASNNLMLLVGNRIYTFPISKAAYPYIQFGDLEANELNTYDKKGAETEHTLYIYTKPDMLGYYPVKSIAEEIDKAIDFKPLTFPDNNYQIAGCKRGRRNYRIENEYIIGTLNFKITYFEKK